MIALDTGDKLRAYASVADKIDYTVHGMVSDDICQLSDGQLAGAEADIYTAPSDAGLVSTLIFVNTHNAAVTCNLYLKPSGGTSRRIIPRDVSIGAGYSLHYDGIRLFINDEKGNVVFYEEGDTVATPSGYAYLMRQADNTLTMPLIDSDRHQQIDVVGLPADTLVAEGGALGKGVLLQGDDGTDRHNVAVNGSGKILVTEQEAANIETHLDHIETRFQADGEAIDYGVLAQGNDGTDRHNLEMAANGDLKVTLDSEVVVLGTGSAAIGKLAANTGVDIGDVDVLSLPTLPAGTNAIGKLAANDGVDIGNVDVASQPADTFVAEGGALGKGILLQGDDGTDRHNVAVDTSGNVQVDIVGALPTGSAAIGKLAANSGVDIGDVDVKSLPNKLATWTQVVVNINTAATTALLAGSAGHTYTIVTISLTIAAENNLTFKSAANAKTGPMDFGASGESHGWQANFWPVGIKCVTGEALNLTTTTTGQVSGIICVLDES